MKLKANTIKKLTKVPMLKLGLIAVLFACFTNNVQAQEGKSKLKVSQDLDLLQKTTTVKQSQADKDWEALNKAKSFFATKKEHEVYLKSSVLGARRYEDKMKTNRSRLAEAFLDKYPQDKRYYEALKMFFHLNFDPLFIPEKISDSLTNILEATQIGLLPQKDYNRNFRALPVDEFAMNSWIKRGNDLAANFLTSNVSMEQKETIAFRLLARDVRIALKWHHLLPKELFMDKEFMEKEYWQQVNKQYFESIRISMEKHLATYASLEITGSHIGDLLNSIQIWAPATIESYWEYFFKMTDSSSTSPLADQAGIKTLHDLAKEQLEIATKRLDLTGILSKPIEMQFTALDGREIDLDKMRGKVVLVDFWTTSCKPCIAAMPHLKAMYDKYQKQGFEVIGITMDAESNKTRVLDILKKKNATWPQRFEGKGYNSDTYGQLYDINVFPTVWLLDKEGKIVAKNIHGNQLEALIRKYLGLEAY